MELRRRVGSAAIFRCQGQEGSSNPSMHTSQSQSKSASELAAIRTCSGPSLPSRARTIRDSSVSWLEPKHVHFITSDYKIAGVVAIACRGRYLPPVNLFIWKHLSREFRSYQSGILGLTSLVGIARYPWVMTKHRNGVFLQTDPASKHSPGRYSIGPVYFPLRSAAICDCTASSRVLKNKKYRPLALPAKPGRFGSAHGNSFRCSLIIGLLRQLAGDPHRHKIERLFSVFIEAHRAWAAPVTFLNLTRNFFGNRTKHAGVAAIL